MTQNTYKLGQYILILLCRLNFGFEPITYWNENLSNRYRNRYKIHTDTDTENQYLVLVSGIGIKPIFGRSLLVIIKWPLVHFDSLNLVSDSAFSRRDSRTKTWWRGKEIEIPGIDSYPRPSHPDSRSRTRSKICGLVTLFATDRVLRFRDLTSWEINVIFYQNTYWLILLFFRSI